MAALIAFSRGHKRWIAVNNATSAQTRTFHTGLPRDTVFIHGNLSNGHCTGPTVHVNAGGNASLTVGAKDAVAFDAGDRLSQAG